MRVQREEELPVREAPGEPVRGVHGERRLANAGHPVDRADAYQAATHHLGQRLLQARQLAFAAGEAADVTWQSPRRGGG